MYNGIGQGRERNTPPRFPKIDEAIKARGSVIKFSIISGIHIQTYYKMQSGASSPNISTIYAILQYTGLTFEQAFGDNKNADRRVQDADRR